MCGGREEEGGRKEAYIYDHILASCLVLFFGFLILLRRCSFIVFKRGTDRQRIFVYVFQEQIDLVQHQYGGNANEIFVFPKTLPYFQGQIESIAVTHFMATERRGGERPASPKGPVKRNRVSRKFANYSTCSLPRRLLRLFRSCLRIYE